MKQSAKSILIVTVTTLLVLGMIGVGSAASASSDSGGDTVDADIADGEIDIAAVEQYVHEAVNEERAAAGADELEFDVTDAREEEVDYLADVARDHSEDMAERGYFSHTDPDGNGFTDRYEDAGYECSVNGYIGGENLAQTWYDTPVNTGDRGIVHYEDEQELGYGIA